MPVATNIFYLVNPVPAIRKDFTPISFAIAALVLMILNVRKFLHKTGHHHCLAGSITILGDILVIIY